MMNRDPMNRPQGPNSGTQVWRDLLFLHWTVSIDQLRKIVPNELEIDTYDGQAFVASFISNVRDMPTMVTQTLALTF